MVLVFCSSGWRHREYIYTYNLLSEGICKDTHWSLFLFWWSAHSDGGKQMTLLAAIALCTRFFCCLCFVSAGFLLHAPSFWPDQLLSRLCTPFLFQPISFELKTSVFSSNASPHLPAPLPHSIRFLLLLFNFWPYIYIDNPPFKICPLASRAT